MVTETIGPVQPMAIGFPQVANCEGGIMGELFGPERREDIRNIDPLFVCKDVKTGDLLARWGISSGLLCTLRPTANPGGKPKEIQR
jgi:hypothetical protein